MTKIILLTMAAIPFVFGCATAPNVPPAKQPTICPTAADKALAAEWEALVAREEAKGDWARETINHTRMPGWEDNLAMLKGDKAVATEEQLAWARQYIRDRREAAIKSCTWPEPSAYGVARTSGAIVIDGKGNDPDWARAAAIPIRYPYAQTNAIDRPAAICRLLWDESNLYVLFEVPDTNIVNTCTNRDEAVSQGDCAEIFLLPSKRFGQYWEFNFSPTGVVFDAAVAKSWTKWGGDFRIEENAALSVATTVDGTLNREEDQDRGYTVEVAIPWGELPGFQHGGKPGDVLWAMIGWADKAGLGKPGNPSYFSHTPVLAWFHNIWGYSRLTLE